MSSIYLVRHGQAGTRQHYDALSELGRRQARLLGTYAATQPTRFGAIYSGELARQRETAEEFLAAFAAAGAGAPELRRDPVWNEFDLDGIYRELAPRLCGDDPGFRADYEEMLRQAADEDSPVHRRWSGADIAVTAAWIEGRYPCREVESWEEFHARIGGALERLRGHASGESVAVFTSATPIAIWAGLALRAPADSVMKLAGVQYNSGLTTMRLRAGELTLFSFNTVPHLTAPELRTFR